MAHQDNHADMLDPSIHRCMNMCRFHWISRDKNTILAVRGLPYFCHSHGITFQETYGAKASGTFGRLSLEYRKSFAFTLTLHHYATDWLEKLAPLCYPIRSKTKNQSLLPHSCFPELQIGHIYLLWVLISSLDSLSNL